MGVDLLQESGHAQDILEDGGVEGGHENGEANGIGGDMAEYTNDEGSISEMDFIDEDDPPIETTESTDTQTTTLPTIPHTPSSQFRSTFDLPIRSTPNPSFATLPIHYPTSPSTTPDSTSETDEFESDFDESLWQQTISHAEASGY